MSLPAGAVVPAPGSTPPSSRPPATRTHDSLVQKRFLEDRPLLAQRVIPSGAPLPLAAQRDFRGWTVLAIIGLILLGTIEMIWLIHAVSGRTVYVAPTAERIGAVRATREPTDFEATTLAMLLVERLESYTPGTASEVWVSVMPYLHPSLHQTMQAAYEEIGRKAAALWQHRIAMPLGVASAGRKTGVITLAVFYDSVELTGQDEAHRVLSRIIPKAAYLELALQEPSPENPLGLVITRYSTYEQAEWQRRGLPALWDHFRTPAHRTKGSR